MRYEIVRCEKTFSRFWSTVVLERWPTHVNIRVLRKAFPGDRTAGVSSRICTVTKRPRSCTPTCASSSCCTSPFAVITTVGVLALLRVSISSELKSLLLSMCIEAPESITHSLSLLEILNWRQCCSGFNRRVERGLVRVFEHLNMFAQSSAALRAHPSSCKVISRGLTANYGAQGQRSWGSRRWVIPLDGPLLSRIFLWCQVLLETLTARSDPHFPALLWNRFSRLGILRHTTHL